VKSEDLKAGQGIRSVTVARDPSAGFGLRLDETGRVPSAALLGSGYAGGGTKFLADNGKFQAVPGPTTYRKITAKTVNTSVAATDLLNGEITVAANVLGANGRLRLTASGDYLQNSGGTTNTWRFQLKLGATTLFDTGAVAQALSSQATRWPWKIIVEIQNTATGTQVAHIQVDVNFGGTMTGSTATFTTGEGRYGGQSTNATQLGGSAYNTSSIDTTAAVALVLNVINPSASATCETKLTSALVEII
jgi:hypothetical protein